MSATAPSDSLCHPQGTCPPREVGTDTKCEGQTDRSKGVFASESGSASLLPKAEYQVGWRGWKLANFQEGCENGMARWEKRNHTAFVSVYPYVIGLFSGFS